MQDEELARLHNAIVEMQERRKRPVTTDERFDYSDNEEVTTYTYN